jgi:hypothetical protein
METKLNEFFTASVSFGFSAFFMSMIVLGSGASAQVHQKRQPNYLSLSLDTSKAEAQTRQA